MSVEKTQIFRFHGEGFKSQLARRFHVKKAGSERKWEPGLRRVENLEKGCGHSAYGQGSKKGKELFRFAEKVGDKHQKGR